MKLSWFGRLALALFASLALGLGMSACGGGTIAYMWVTGTQYNQIAGFKVDDYTGNLTQVPGGPFSSQGANPNMLLVKLGGRYVYVLNQGSADTPTANSADANVSVFSVGGDGSLTFLESYTNIQGSQPVWMQFDSSSGYLYVLSKYSPAYNASTSSSSYDVNGSITVYSIDSTTGRLTLVLNTQSVPPGGAAPTYWEVGTNPLMMKSLGSCLFTVNSGDQSITPFSESGSQLVNVTTGKIATGGNQITSINGSGQTVVLTDAGANSVITYSIAGSCGLSAAYGGVTPLSSGAAAQGTIDPTYSFIDSTGQHLYILNQQNTNTSTSQSYSLITGLLIQSTGLTPLTAAPYQVQAAPVCMVEDPTNKYMYISNRDPGAVTGKKLDPSTGALSELPRGSNFSATGLAGCMDISGAVD
jgi:6-phosphogluconolactonase (cycloisomerase 2 family)